MEPSSKRPTVSAGVVLPPDVLWEILLRVRAKPLCRFRAVCRPWRSLLSDPSFIKAHAVLQPYLILALTGENDRVDVRDLSGNVVRRIRMASKDVGVPHNTHPGPFYLLVDHYLNRARVRVVDPGTGAGSTLPFDNRQQGVGSFFIGSYALGHVASTGKRKVLRVVTRNNCRTARRIEQHCDVFTLGDDDGRRSWRPMARAPLCVEFDNIDRHFFAHNAVIQGVAYFLPDRRFPNFNIFGAADDFAIDTNCVMAFDLQTEQWRPATFPGPPTRIHGYHALKLAKLNGSLVMLCHSRGFHDHPTTEMDLWFATDLEKGVWVKEHNIRLGWPDMRPWMCVPDFQLLTALDDGRFVFYYYSNSSSASAWRIQIYDPRTKASTDVPQHGVRYIAGMYRGSMLCVENR